MLQLRNYLINGFGGGKLLNFQQFKTASMAIATCGEELPYLTGEKQEFPASSELSALHCHGRAPRVPGRHPCAERAGGKVGSFERGRFRTE